jgi:hypothetical protein
MQKRGTQINHLGVRNLWLKLKHHPISGGGFGSGGQFGGGLGGGGQFGGARPRDTAPQNRLLDPIIRNDAYIPRQHTDSQQSQPRQQQINNNSNYNSYQNGYNGNGRGGGFTYSNSNQNSYNGNGRGGGVTNSSSNNYNVNGYGQTSGGGYGNGYLNGSNSWHGMVNNGPGINGNGYGNSGNGASNGYSPGPNYNGGRQTEYGGQQSCEYGREGGGGGERQPSGFMAAENEGASATGSYNGQENIQHADMDRLVTRQGGAAEPVVPQPGQQRQRLGSKRNREGASYTSDTSPPKTRQRQ